MPTLLHRLSAWADERPQSIAQRFKRPGASGDAWESITAREYRDHVYHLALFLESRGMTARDVGCVFSPNCAPWVHMDLATLLLGAKSAGLYPNSVPKDVGYILEHTATRFLAVKDREFFTKAGELPARIELVVVFEGDATFSPKAISYEDALAEGRRLAATAPPFKSYLAKLDPRAGSILIYTSGTTGNPKGVLLSHDNFCYTSDRVSEYWKLPSGGSMFSFLPLCHVAEKLQSVAVGISKRYTVSFCTKFELVAQELPEVQPTLLLCVPRLWEKMMEGVLHKIERAPKPRKRLAHWALSVGARAAERKYGGRAIGRLLQAELALADRLVLAKIRAALGLAKADVLASGAAALPAHVSRWFRALRLEILEDFGQTESTGVICMTQSGVESAGTVGQPVPGMEMKIAPDVEAGGPGVGEMLTRGRHVFVGYFKDEAATAATIVDGWLRTGDLAERVPDGPLAGLVRIRGRKKEVLKTSGGKMVAPLPLEEKLKESSWIGQACIVGDGRKYLSVLLTLPEARLAPLKPPGTERVISDPFVRGEIEKTVAELNAHLAGYEQIKRFTVLAREFSVELGEMTPTLKMKRGTIEARYKDLIDQMYA